MSATPYCAAVQKNASRASVGAAKYKHAKKGAALARHTTTARPGPDHGAVAYGRRDDVMQFAAEVAARQNLDAAAVQDALAQARFVPSVARLIMPAPVGTAKNWGVYRDRFIEPVRIRAGVAFWQANEAWLNLAEQRYGVPPDIVVGIIGVETLYGQQSGGFRVIDALATLAFDFPVGRKDRSAFFRDQLEQLLVLSQREGSDPLALKGSYAGALGMPQFMPGSVVKYAVDFDSDGHIDLLGSSADAIGSVAHYLAEFGWQRGLPPYLEVTAPSDASNLAWLLAPDILPSFTAQEFIDRGALFAAPSEADSASQPEPIATPTSAAAAGKLALVELQNGAAAPSYVAGTSNFYAVTRYNWSSYYAMAVIELGRAVKRSR
jgi:membrane-bound lytic murein transglycosylase B